MAQEIRTFTANIPAGTPASSPVTVDLTLPVRIVDRVEFVVPPGGSGLVGFALAISGLTIIPYLSDDFIVTADEKIGWDLQGYPDSGDWSLIGYNTGAIAHAIYVRFLCRIPQLVPTGAGPAFDATTVLPDDSLTAAPSVDTEDGL